MPRLLAFSLPVPLSVRSSFTSCPHSSAKSHRLIAHSVTHFARMSLIHALDFDGVICDSVAESTTTAIRAAKYIWPNLPDCIQGDGTPASHIVDSMKSLRPVIETGYENVLLARLMMEKGDHDLIESVLSGWSHIRDNIMTEWAVGKDQLVEVFGRVRDEWIEKDVDAWVAANSMFPRVVDALNSANGPVYIITTKQTRFCLLLLQRSGVTSVSEENVFGLGSGSKISILKKILALPENKGRKLMFVEDRYETLEAVSLSMLGQPLELYLATWGYNTEKTRNVAKKHPFINLLDLDSFVAKLN